MCVATGVYIAVTKLSLIMLVTILNSKSKCKCWEVERQSLKDCDNVNKWSEYECF